MQSPCSALQALHEDLHFLALTSLLDDDTVDPVARLFPCVSWHGVCFTFVQGAKP